MMTPYEPRRSSTGPFLAFILALLLGALAVVLFLRHANSGVLARIATAVTGRASVTFDTSVPAVVQKIQRLNRLETVVYSLDTVIEGSKSSAVLPDLLGGDRLLMIVHGESIAGIDLSKLHPEDVRIDGRSIHVTLPASELFVTTIDNQRTRVYARSTGLLTSADQNLESETRARAQDQLQKDALSDGILDAARKNARATVTTLLYGLGFQHVEVM
ncbi:DUF4230 domain-containing protein [Edaphobacter paludis]|uniref:DUF4230 domain-containing protein n=1 Tax=Edaphobacter paludis TaxID=3035702 RepID=A0AAU7D6E4_9BACT